MGFDAVPDELLVFIFGRLEHPYRSLLALVCVRWERVVAHDPALVAARPEDLSEGGEYSDGEGGIPGARKRVRMPPWMRPRGHLPAGYEYRAALCDSLPSSYDPLEWAAENGAVDLLEWALASCTGPCTGPWRRGSWAPIAAAGRNDVRTLRLLEAHGFSVRLPVVCVAAVEGRSVGALMWLQGLSPPCPLTARSVLHAATRGEVGLLRWMHKRAPELFGKETALHAAAAGQLKALQWLRGLDPPCMWGARQCLGEARDGVDHVEGAWGVVKWMASLERDVWEVRRTEEDEDWSEFTEDVRVYLRDV